MRVIERRHHLLRPRRRARPGRPRARRRRGRRGAARRARRAAAAAAPAGSRAAADRAPPAEVPAERKAELLRELDERGRGAGRRDRPVHRLLRRGPPRGQRRQLRRPASAGDDRTRTRIGAQAVARRGDTVETGAETLGAHRGFELLEDDPGADRRAGGAQGADPARRRPGPVRLDAGRRRRRLRRRPLPRDDRPRPRGRPHPEGRQRLRRQARRAGRPAAAERLRRRPPAGRVGQRRDRRRGRADPEDAGDRGRAARSPTSTTTSPPSATASPRPATAAARASATCRSRG